MTLQERTSTLAADVRNLSHELHPSVLDHAGLVPVLKAHCDEFTRLAESRCRLQCRRGRPFSRWLPPPCASIE